MSRHLLLELHTSVPHLERAGERSGLRHGSAQVNSTFTKHEKAGKHGYKRSDR